MRKDTGFTILEVMIVIAIISILCGIATPNLIKWLPRHRVGSAARELKSTLEFARISAVKTNTDVTANFNWVPPSVTVVDSGGTTLRTRRLPADVRFYDLDLGVSVTFNGHGFASKSGWVYTENVNGDPISYIIKLTLGGNTSIESMD